MPIVAQYGRETAPVHHIASSLYTPKNPTPPLAKSLPKGGQFSVTRAECSSQVFRVIVIVTVIVTVVVTVIHRHRSRHRIAIVIASVSSPPRPPACPCKRQLGDWICASTGR